MPLTWKADGDDLIVSGEVYVPFRLDVDNEFARPSEIELAMHRFMAASKMRNVDTEHQLKKANVIIVENYKGKQNDPDGFHQDAWVATGRVTSPEIKRDVLSGKLNGWSVFGKSQKIPRTVRIQAVTTLKGETFDSTLPGLEPHKHTFTIKFDKDGVVVPTRTSMVLGHDHPIEKTTATESALLAKGEESFEHAHRYDVDWSAKSEGVEYEERIQKATELVNIIPSWLSLVEHAAIRRAFKIIKADDHQHQPGGFADMDRFVQAILLDSGADLSEEVSKTELLAGLKVDDLKILKLVPMGKHEKYVLQPIENFIPGTCRRIGTNNPRIRLNVGEMIDSIIAKSEAVILGSAAQQAFAVEDEKPTEKGDEDMDEKQIRELVGTEVRELLKTELPLVLENELGTFKSDVLTAIKGKTAGNSGTAKAEDDKAGTPDPVLEALKNMQGVIDGLKSELTAKNEELVKKSDELEAQITKYGKETTSIAGSLLGYDDDTVLDDLKKGDGKTPDKDDKTVHLGGRLFGGMRPKVAAYLRRMEAQGE